MQLFGRCQKIVIQQPGSGSSFLRNTSAVFYRHYFDRRQARTIPQPSPLPKLPKAGAKPQPATEPAIPTESGDMGELLRQAIRESGQAVAKIAKATGVHAITIGDFLRGIDMGIGRAGKIAAYLRLSLQPNKQTAVPETQPLPEVSPDEPAPTVKKRGRKPWDKA